MSTYKDASGRWRYRFSFKNKRYKGSSPKEANKQKVAETLERQHLDRLLAQRFDGVMPTVSAFVVRFLDFQRARVKPLTLELQEFHLNKHVVPNIGKKPLDQVAAVEIDGLVTLWKKTAMPRTINTRLGTLLRMFGLAVEWGILVAVPRATFLKIPKDTPRFLSEPEAATLLEASTDLKRSDSLEWRSMVLVGLRTGMRIGELRGLQWGDIDLERAIVNVRRTDPGRAAFESTSPKGGRGRMIPLTPDAIACLRERAEIEKARLGKAFAPACWVWPAGAWRGKERDGTRAQGGCINAITRFAVAAGLEDIGWHTLRHTYASWLVMRGVSLRAVQELLGHASIKQTERYSHLAPGFVNHALVASLDLPLAPAAPMLPPGDDNK